MESSNAMVMLAMFSWPLVALLVFSQLSPRKAVIVLFLAGWMFLPPNAMFKLPGIPEYNKTTATTLGIMLGVVVFDLKTITSLRPCWGDMPIVAYCLIPFVSSITNNLGMYDGTSGVVKEAMSWGLPYMLGRAYLRNFEAFQDIAKFIFIAGLIYIPFCMYEIRMSPQLNRYLYGYGTVGGGEYSNELGSWGSRPRVFMGTGLAVGTFMTAASLAGIWMLYTGAIRKICGFNIKWLVLALTVVTFMCKNMGALALLIFGLLTLFSIPYLKRAVMVYLLIAAAPLYMAYRATGAWSAEMLVDIAASIHKQRGDSLQDRLRNDSMLAEKALQRPVFGWGGWGRARIYREDGKDISITDGLWIIVLGNTGIAGLTALTAVLLIPPLLFVRRYPVQIWTNPQVAPTAVMAIMVVLYMIDNLFNSMFNPLYVMSAGGLVTLSTTSTASSYSSSTIQSSVQFCPLHQQRWFSNISQRDRLLIR